MLFAASTRNERWWCHGTSLRQPGKPPSGPVGLLDWVVPCFLPFCVLQVQFQIRGAKLRPVLNILSYTVQWGLLF